LHVFWPSFEVFLTEGGDCKQVVEPQSPAADRIIISESTVFELVLSFLLCLGSVPLYEEEHYQSFERLVAFP
jgi:hypothetical protein